MIKIFFQNIIWIFIVFAMSCSTSKIKFPKGITSSPEQAPVVYPQSAPDNKPFKIFTYEEKTDSIIIYGENLKQVDSLYIGPNVINLTVSPDGITATGLLPPRLQNNQRIVAVYNDTIWLLNEPYTTKKNEIPKLNACTFGRNTKIIPECIANNRGLFVTFDCDVENYTPGDAMNIVYFGDYPIYENQFFIRDNHLIGYITPQQLRNIKEGELVMTVLGGHFLSPPSPNKFSTPPP